MVNKPRIVCAANKYFIEHMPDAEYILDNEIEELIIAGARHWDSVMRGVWDTLDDYTISCIDRNKEVQGFIDQFGNFYDRKEAYKIAKENNQIIRDLGHDNGELFSEHLY